LAVLGGKLRRCRAVFNRLCTSPFILDFLEPYPLNLAGAADYYRVIKSPMWLREVHSRLVDGAYDNEFDFAWDVRLVFSNCCLYNAQDSDLYKAAQQLIAEFECLLCDWVHNIQDCSVDNIATGPWDEWAYLKYFDAADYKENFCRETGTRTIEVRSSDITDMSMTAFILSFASSHRHPSGLMNNIIINLLFFQLVYLPVSQPTYLIACLSVCLSVCPFRLS
jgi:Bromodomain